MPLYQEPTRKFSSIYLLTAPGVNDDLVMDMALPTGGVTFNELFNTTGTGTTSATVGDTVQITHGLGVVPNFITITETSDGIVYVDTTVAATSTTFNVKGSVASLTFNWKVE